MNTPTAQKRAKRRRQAEQQRKNIQHTLMKLVQSKPAMPGSYLHKMCKEHGIEPFTGKLIVKTNYKS